MEAERREEEEDDEKEGGKWKCEAALKEWEEEEEEKYVTPGFVEEVGPSSELPIQEKFGDFPFFPSAFSLSRWKLAL